MGESPAHVAARIAQLWATGELDVEGGSGDDTELTGRSGGSREPPT